MREVHLRGLRLEGDEVLLGLVRALLEGRQAGHSLVAERELGVDLGEVDGNTAGGQHDGGGRKQQAGAGERALAAKCRAPGEEGRPPAQRPQARGQSPRSAAGARSRSAAR